MAFQYVPDFVKFVVPYCNGYLVGDFGSTHKGGCCLSLSEHGVYVHEDYAKYTALPLFCY